MCVSGAELCRGTSVPRLLSTPERIGRVCCGRRRCCGGTTIAYRSRRRKHLLLRRDDGVRATPTDHDDCRAKSNRIDTMRPEQIRKTRLYYHRAEIKTVAVTRVIRRRVRRSYVRARLLSGAPTGTDGKIHDGARATTTLVTGRAHDDD